jgi:hypothetical protein
MTFDGSSSVVDFSFKRKLLADVGLNGTVVAYCWFSDAARLTWYSDGRMKYNVGGTDMASYVLNSTGGTLDPNVADGYITVSGSLDYATKTYTLTVDGVAQNGGNPIAFYDSNATTINASIINANPHNSLYRRYAYDDISLTPEPATLGLLSVGGLALLRRRKK